MSVVIGIAILLFGSGFLVRSASQARNGGAWTGPRTPGMRQRAAAGGRAGSGQRPIRHEVKRIWAETHAADWLKQRDHERSMAAKNGGSGSAPTGQPPAATGPGRVRTVTAATVKRLGTFKPGGRGGNGNSNAPGGGAQPGAAPTQTIPAPNGNGRAPSPPPAARPAAPASPRTSPSSASSGGNGTVAAGTSTGSVEKLVEGYNQIHAEASSGGIHAKRRGIQSAAEGSTRGAQMASMLSRTMSEPGANYGPEITEPLSKAAQHLQAAAMAFAESDAALTNLMQMSVGELASSNRQAPHHTELSENGSH